MITVYGASDDLIEVEGDITEEFNPGDEPSYLAFSDGTVLSIEYTQQGLWAIRKLRSGTAAFTLTQATDEDDDYSDRATLDGDVRWVVFGSRFEAA